MVWFRLGERSSCFIQWNSVRFFKNLRVPTFMVPLLDQRLWSRDFVLFCFSRKKRPFQKKNHKKCWQKNHLHHPSHYVHTPPAPRPEKGWPSAEAWAQAGQCEWDSSWQCHRESNRSHPKLQGYKALEIIGEGVLHCTGQISGAEQCKEHWMELSNDISIYNEFKNIMCFSKKYIGTFDKQLIQQKLASQTK